MVGSGRWWRAVVDGGGTVVDGGKGSGELEGCG